MTSISSLARRGLLYAIDAKLDAAGLSRPDPRLATRLLTRRWPGTAVNSLRVRAWTDASVLEDTARAIAAMSPGRLRGQMSSFPEMAMRLQLLLLTRSPAIRGQLMQAIDADFASREVPSECDVAILGGGLHGSVLANAVASKALTAVLFDAGPGGGNFFVNRRTRLNFGGNDLPGAPLQVRDIDPGPFPNAGEFGDVVKTNLWAAFVRGVHIATHRTIQQLRCLDVDEFELVHDGTVQAGCSLVFAATGQKHPVPDLGSLAEREFAGIDAGDAEAIGRLRCATAEQVYRLDPTGPLPIPWHQLPGDTYVIGQSFPSGLAVVEDQLGVFDGGYHPDDYRTRNKIYWNNRDRLVNGMGAQQEQGIRSPSEALDAAHRGHLVSAPDSVVAIEEIPGSANLRLQFVDGQSREAARVVLAAIRSHNGVKLRFPRASLSVDFTELMDDNRKSMEATQRVPHPGFDRFGIFHSLVDPAGRELQAFFVAGAGIPQSFEVAQAAQSILHSLPQPADHGGLFSTPPNPHLCEQKPAECISAVPG